MKCQFLVILIFLTALNLTAQKTDFLYLSGTDKDHTVQWDFFCTSGRNSERWSSIGVPSNWELQGFGTYHYGKTDLSANEKGLYNYEFSVPRSWGETSLYSF